MTEIYHRDRHIVVCEKPSGVLSEGEGENGMPGRLKQELGVPQVYVVHRLDRETSGIMVYALTQKAAAGLSADIAAGKLTKEYVAEIHGIPEPREGAMTDLLFYDRQRGRSYVVDRERKGVKEARLRYRTLESDGGISRVHITLDTGRTHQIRVQFASRKMPLVGDRRYGAPDVGKPFSLRACRLSFCHPMTKETLCFGDRDGEFFT